MGMTRSGICVPLWVWVYWLESPFTQGYPIKLIESLLYNLYWGAGGAMEMDVDWILRAENERMFEYEENINFVI